MKPLRSNGLSRRELFAVAGLSAGAALLAPGALFAERVGAMSGGEEATAGQDLGAKASFGAVEQIEAGVLNVGYVDAGPRDGTAVLLLHGWPYDIHSFVEVVPLLTSKGYRVIVPYLRGYGTTRSLSASTVRNGQQSALALDMIHLMDALKIRKAIV